jgi:hypothetical protein
MAVRMASTGSPPRESITSATPAAAFGHLWWSTAPVMSCGGRLSITV